MTIAIGADYIDGIIICADTKVVASDGATTSDMKISLALGPPQRAVAVATAAEDARAATMLAEEISLAAGARDAGPEHIKAIMTAWHNAYGEQRAPQLQFVLGDGVNQTIYLCEPPATVWECGPIAIGRGSRAVEPFLDIPHGLVPHSASMRATLLRMAFLMYRAKKDEGSSCGGDTHTAVLPRGGMFFLVPKEEMAVAEKLAAEIDGLMIDAARMITADLSIIDGSGNSLGKLSSQYEALLERWRNLDFPSIRFHEWEKGKKQKSLASTVDSTR
jgi:20S proteasome alpha/beta subunit